MRVYSPNNELRGLHALSDRRHTFVAAPAEAEIILVLLPWKDGRQIEIHELVALCPHKCFVVSTTDLPQYTAHGIYSTVSGFWGTFGNRIRSGSYQIGAKRFKNPFIEGEQIGSGTACSKKYLFSFVGRDCHPTRQALLNIQWQRSDVLIEDSSKTFALWDENRNGQQTVQRQQYFCDLLRQTKFALCPRGVGPNSIRLFEAMKLGVAPVIISDGWKFPLGPRWRDFSIVVPEKQVWELERIVGEREHEYQAMGQRAAAAYEAFFSEHAYFNFLVENCLDIMRRQWLPERFARTVIKISHLLNSLGKQARKRAGIRTRLMRILDVLRGWPSC
jgi:hypothetical protein